MKERSKEWWAALHARVGEGDLPVGVGNIAQAWRPISTAPIDTEIDLLVPLGARHIRNCHWENAPICGKPMWRVRGGRPLDPRNGEPTHWRPATPEQ